MSIRNENQDAEAQYIADEVDATKDRDDMIKDQAARFVSAGERRAKKNGQTDTRSGR